MNGDPLLLDVGVHFINEPSFEFESFKSIDEALIKCDPVNILTVQSGMVVPVLINGEGHFLLARATSSSRRASSARGSRR